MAKEKNKTQSKRTKPVKVARQPLVKKTSPKGGAKIAREKKTAVKTRAKKRVVEKQAKAPKAKKGKDTGSVEVQVDNFTVKVKSLIKHLKKHNGDNDSRRGLLIMVGKRRRLLNYIKKSDPKRYAKIVQKLKLKE